VPIVKEKVMGYRGYLDAARESLLKGRGARKAGRGRIYAAVGHALAFTTWRSLAEEQRLDDASCVDLMFRFIAQLEN
jgi:hypothetical protein